jgi:hypothetical protein
MTISLEEFQQFIVKIIHPMLIKNVLFDDYQIEYRLSAITLLEKYSKYIYEIDLFISIDIPDKTVCYDIKQTPISLTVSY